METTIVIRTTTKKKKKKPFHFGFHPDILNGGLYVRCVCEIKFYSIEPTNIKYKPLWTFQITHSLGILCKNIKSTQTSNFNCHHFTRNLYSFSFCMWRMNSSMVIVLEYKMWILLKTLFRKKKIGAYVLHSKYNWSNRNISGKQRKNVHHWKYSP